MSASKMERVTSAIGHYRARRLTYRPILCVIEFIVGAVVLRVFVSSAAAEFMAMLIFINALAALGLNVIFGMAQLISIAQAAVMAVSAYTMGILIADHHVYLPLAAVAGVAAATIVSAFAGLVAERIRSHYYILVTLSIAGAIQLFLINGQEITGGANGMQVPIQLALFGQDLTTNDALVIVGLAMVLVGWYCAASIGSSRTGRAITLAGANEHLALSCGVSPRRMWLVASIIGGAFAGVAGVLFTMVVQYLGPSDFELDQALLLLLIVVVGGMGSPTGVVVAAAVVTYLSNGFLQLTSVGPLVYGAGIVLLLIVMPTGLAGLLRLIARRTTTTWSRLRPT